MAKLKAKHRKKDLVSLFWSDNACYPSTIDGVPKGVTIDKVAGHWIFGPQALPIGSRRDPCMPIVGDPIGVYDKTNRDHLIAMEKDIEWAKSRNRPVSIKA